MKVNKWICTKQNSNYKNGKAYFPVKKDPTRGWYGFMVSLGEYAEYENKKDCMKKVRRLNDKNLKKESPETLRRLK